MEGKQNEKRTAQKVDGPNSPTAGKNQEWSQNCSRTQSKSSLQDQKRFRKTPNTTEDTKTRQIREKWSLPAGMSHVS